MSESKTCPTCGADMPSGALSGLCPRCMLGQGIGLLPDSSESSNSETPLFGDLPGSTNKADSSEHPATNDPTVPRTDSPSTPHDPARSSDPAETRYELLGEIARGGMGAVLKGRDPMLRRDLAVKVLLEAHRDRPELVRRFVEEAQIGGQLQHPGIVPVYELGTFPDRGPYFTMKLVRGNTLASLLDARPDPDHDRPKFLGIFEQVCQTMAYAHAHKVIHRDLKPSNVMVGAFGEVQVMDWGLAKVLSKEDLTEDLRDALGGSTPVQTASSESGLEGSRPGSVMGTPSYMSPEQAQGEIDRVDERSDVFALGSILCEILTGRPAYVGATSAEVMRLAQTAGLDGAFKRLEAADCDPELLTLARRCLAADPDDRAKDAGEVASAISAHLVGVQERLRSAELARVEAQARAEEERKRRKTELRFAAGLLTVLLAGIIGVATQWNRAERHLGEVTVANNKLTEANAEIVRGRDEAIARRDLALQAIDTFTKGTSEDVILKEPKLAELRAKLLGGALEFYQKLQNRLEADPNGSPVELADGYNRIARINRQVSRFAEAKKAYEQELETRERLARDRPEDPSREAARLAARTKISNILYDTGRAGEALTSLQSDAKAWEQLIAAHPERLDVVTAMADYHILLGAIFVDKLDRPAEAIKYFERAESQLDRLTRDHPERKDALLRRAGLLFNISISENRRGHTDDALRRGELALTVFESLQRENAVSPDLRLHLGRTRTHIANLFRTLGRGREALLQYRNAVGTFERLISDYPNVTEYQGELASTLNNLATLWADAGRSNEAIGELRKSIVITERLTRDYPQVQKYRIFHCSTIRTLGFTLRNLGKPAEAIIEAENALKMTEALARDFPSDPNFQNELATCHVLLASLHVALKKPVDAEREYRNAAELYRKTTTPDASSLYNEACVQSRIAALVSAGPNGTDPSGREEAARHADQAVRTLARSIAAGFRQPGAIRDDSDFEPLRARNDFQLLLLDAAFPIDPFTR